MNHALKIEEKKMHTIAGRLLRATALSLSASLFLTSCAPPYTPKIMALTPADQSSNVAQIPGTSIKLAAFFYNQKEAIERLFPEHSKWFWKGRIAIVKVDVSYSGQTLNQLTFNSGYVTDGGMIYPIVSANETYDMAWGAGNPYVRFMNDLYNAALLAFSFITLGLGSLVYVLPSPFDQPAPASTVFGRDINYHAMPHTVTLQPGAFYTGLVYIALPDNKPLDKLHDAQLVLLLSTKTTGAAVPREVTINLPDVVKAK